MLARIQEAVLILLVLSAWARSGPLVLLLRSLSARYQTLIAGLVILVIVGHLASVNSFPFVTWNMYGKPEVGDPVVYEYAAVLKSGRTLPLVLSRLLSSMEADRLVSKLYRQIRSLKSATPPGGEAGLRAQHEETLAAVGRLYSHKFPGDPLETIVVTSKTIRLHPPRAAETSAPEVLWRVRVGQVTH